RTSRGLSVEKINIWIEQSPLFSGFFSPRQKTTAPRLLLPEFSSLPSHPVPGENTADTLRTCARATPRDQAAVHVWFRPTYYSCACSRCVAAFVSNAKPFRPVLDANTTTLRDLQPNLNGPQNTVRMPLL